MSDITVYANCDSRRCENLPYIKMLERQRLTDDALARLAETIASEAAYLLDASQEQARARVYGRIRAARGKGNV